MTANFLAFVAVIVAVIVAIIAGVLANRESVSRRRGRLLLFARLSVGIAAVLYGLYPLLVRWWLPQHGVEGIIQSVSVRNHIATVRVGVAPAGTVVLYAECCNPHFRAGERVQVRYQERTGNVRKAEFLSEDGRIEGAYRDTGWMGPTVILIAGLWILFGSVRMHKRDPEGGEEGPANMKPYGPVDKWSLLGDLEEKQDAVDDH